MIAQLRDSSRVDPFAIEHPVLRGEAFSLEHLEQHARHLASAHQLLPRPARDNRFALRFQRNADFIQKSYRATATSIREGEPLTPDAEWLLDNFYVVEEQLHEIREDLPQRFYWELPKLITGEPRVYALAVELVVHTDSALDEETIVHFIREYQTVTPLTIGEVWAIPIMLRLVLVENLRLLAEQMVSTRRCRQQAQQLLAARQAPDDFTIDFTTTKECAPLVLQVWEQLQVDGHTAPQGIRRLEKLLCEFGLTPHDIAQREHQRQAANQVSIGNVITSMRLISALDWMAFFERTNLAERVLRRDPACVYSQMDIESRNRYRNAVEDLSRRTRVPDHEVAEMVLQHSEQALRLSATDSRPHHVGYWLVDQGRPVLEAELEYRPAWDERIRRLLLRHPRGFFFGSLAFWTLLAVGGLLAAADALGLGWLALVIMGLLAIVPATELAVQVTNLGVTRVLRPRLLPKLEFKDGIPHQHATFVVIPSLLASERDARSLLSHLEVHYLSNPEGALKFALLTDFPDAKEAELPHDRIPLVQAIAGIQLLNERYGSEGRGPFYLFHRHRQWNEEEGIWMGWERKRGKLMEFNRLLHGAGDTSYSVQEGDLDALSKLRAAGGFRYVITLDADTQLPHGAARRMVGALAHPLNRPVYDAAQGRVISGYSILQPRVSVHLASANTSWFSRIFADSPGIDPYTTAASDVYQDLFGEGSFTGKGIYDLEIFEQCLDGVFPENRILSHDLIEGCHARVALVSDIELIDSFPSRYDADVRRHHRWIRGDWQILPWLGARVPLQRGRRRNPLHILSRWKILDNLRRSVVPPALMLFLLVGWIAWPAAAWLWSLGGLLVLTLPVISGALFAFRGRGRGVHRLHHVQDVVGKLTRTAAQTGIKIATLPHHAVTWVDAIARTLFRMHVSRRRLLEWETASDAEHRLSRSRWSCLQQTWYLSVIALTLLILLPAAARWAALPWLLGWFLAPLLTHWISQPIAVKTAGLEPLQRLWLRRTARKTWMFFERYVGEKDHWLPPDNMQEYPAEKVAHRLSPTNEGLYLLSALVARDFGYLTTDRLAALWERSADSLDRLEKLRGHFLNWYDTLTLKPLLPRYVSTVDSGNLAACFLTIYGSVDELRRSPLFSMATWEGIRDTLDVALEACDQLQPKGARIVSEPLDELCRALSSLRQQEIGEPETIPAWHRYLQESTPKVAELRQRLHAFVESGEFPETDLRPKVEFMLHQMEQLDAQWKLYFSWFDHLDHSEHGADATLRAQLCERRSLQDLKHLEGILPDASESGDSNGAPAHRQKLRDALRSAAHHAGELEGRLLAFGQRMQRLALQMDFKFLYNPQRRLFSIGFNVEDGRLDRAHYDMLCSEARLASYLAISKGDVEPRHWFQLGRLLTQAAGQATLLSWGGTMFEYLMPCLFQQDYEGSLLHQSVRAAIARQIEYGRQHGVPWGISESAFGALAVNSDYHYRSFGVPGLGLKRGLAKDLVISPYSTMLALELNPSAAYSNLRELAEEGALGAWGMYDAIDYTPERVPVGKRSIVVRCFMAHHQGMSMLSLANLLNGGSIRRRFHAHPLPRASELLLQERLHLASPRVEPHADEVAAVEIPRSEEELVSRRFSDYRTPTPRTHLLANGRYSVMLTSTGGGYSRYRDIAVSRWRPDPTCDHYGQFFYLRDVRSQKVWSATYQPTRVVPDSYEVLYSIDKAEYRRVDGDLETHLEVAVSPENNAEVRTLKITNHSSQTRHIEVTSYLEVALNSQAADVSHPAFQKLFIETEYIRDETTLLARRRPRDPRDADLWAVHVLSAGTESTVVEYETSRQSFLGRGRSPQDPAALDPGVQLSHQVGAVLDPIFSIRCTVAIRPNEAATLGFATALAHSRDEALAIADQYHDARGVQRAFELAWAFNQVQLRHLLLSPAQSHLFQRLAAAALYPDPARRGSIELMRNNRHSQRALWRFGISGDLPIAMIHVTKPEHVAHVRELLMAQSFWQSHGLAVDLVILNDYPGSYLDALNDQLVALLAEWPRKPEPRSAGAFLVRGAQLLPEDKALLELVASLVFHGELGSIAQQWQAASNQSHETQKVRNDAARSPIVADAGAVGGSEVGRRQELIGKLEFWNGVGGFANEGREYRILLAGETSTPMPWSNVIANPNFGTLVTDSGGGYTWSVNSREFKLTSWSNDPVSDPPSEMLYVRDERTGHYWSPMAGPLRSPEDYWVHHGQGYSRFLHRESDIENEVLISIAPEDSVKFIRLKLRNVGSSTRQLACTYFAEWVLGVHRDQTQLYIQTERDPETGALLAQNSFHPSLSHQVGFLQVLGGATSYTGSRAEFIGRCRDLGNPEGMERSTLSGQTGIGIDPCGAMQTVVTLEPGDETEIVFLLGCGTSRAEALQLVDKYRDPESVQHACDQTRQKWDDILETIQVSTPNRALDLLVNRWLLYQTLGCRMWGRSAFYQSGGAFGFRDQLQDSMSVVYSRPDLVREHLLLAASRQFLEGDVQHWWHPPEGNGTRTKFSDDLLWLPLVTCHYLKVTQDTSILDERVSYLTSAPLDIHEQERYENPSVSDVSGTLYEHCRKTIERGFRLGPHGLPLMGCGDWNDGMNRVGELGQGESIWVGWFLLVILRDFLPVMESRGEHADAAELRRRADDLRKNLEEHGWDGDWYRRAYFDDGTPLGSSQNDECQIDSIAQTWAVFAEGDPNRARHAVQAVLQRLVRWDSRLVLLFTPPFDRTRMDPGYVKGYLPGIRENGGQYTHPVMWLIQALCELGTPTEALGIFDLVNPIHHAATYDQAAKYKVEPYVVAADVYGVAPHTGRGGWTWYTGSASWMYRVALESLLGMTIVGDQMTFQTRMPAGWSEFKLRYRRGGATWNVTVRGVSGDHQRCSGPSIDLRDDGGTHDVEIRCPM